VSGQFDPNCQCKTLLDQSGNNACMKTTGTTFSAGTALGAGYLTNSGVASVISNANSMLTGTSNLANLSSATLAKAIATQNGLNNQLYKAAQTDPTKKDLPILNTNAALIKAQNAILTSKDIASLASAAGGSALSSVGGSPLSAPLADAIKAAQKSTGLDLSGGTGISGKKTAKPEFSFNLSDNAPVGGSATTQNFMDKNYNYKENDIVKKPDTSIFDIISNRYIESGLKRLFDDK
jgi:hypothetical protein